MKKLLLVGFIVALALVATPVSAFVFNNNLTLGSEGTDVTELQKILVDKGHLTMPATATYGKFGDLTKAAVIAYQIANNISPAEGFVGPATRLKLNQISNPDIESFPTLSISTSSAGGRLNWNIAGTYSGGGFWVSEIRSPYGSNDRTYTPISGIGFEHQVPVRPGETVRYSIRLATNDKWSNEVSATYPAASTGTDTPPPSAVEAVLNVKSTGDTSVLISGYRLGNPTTFNPSGIVYLNGNTENYSKSHTTSFTAYLTAPSTSDGASFSSWSDCLYTGGAFCGVSVNAGETKTVTANYTAALPLVQPGIPTVSLTADKTSITAGQSVTLTLTSSNADYCIGSVAGSQFRTSGTLTFSPTQTYTYKDTCYKTVGSNTAESSSSVTVNVAQTSTPPPPPASPTPLPPTITFSANPASITAGQVSTLSWSAPNATSCSDSGSLSNLVNSPSGSLTVGPLSESKTYEIKCTNTAGQTTKTVTVTVAGSLAPTVTLTSNKSAVPSGGYVDLTWSSNANSCSGTGWLSGISQPGGFKAVGPLSQNTTFTVTCTNAGGLQTSKSVTVNVSVVEPPPSSAKPNIKANGSDGPITLKATDPIDLTWDTNGGTSCTVTKLSNNVLLWSSTNSYRISSADASSKYKIYCSSNGQSDEVEVNVTTSSADLISAQLANILSSLNQILLQLNQR